MSSRIERYNTVVISIALSRVVSCYVLDSEGCLPGLVYAGEARTEGHYQYSDYDATSSSW